MLGLGNVPVVSVTVNNFLFAYQIETARAAYELSLLILLVCLVFRLRFAIGFLQFFAQEDFCI